MNNTPANQNNAVQLRGLSEAFVPKVIQQLKDYEINPTEYQKQLASNAMQKIYEIGKSSNFTVADWKFNNSNIQSALLTIMSLQLDANADPAEVYFSTRNVYQNKQYLGKSIELGVQGQGNDTLLARFGRNVKYIHPFWEVHKNDQYTPAIHKGIEIEPPTWEESDGDRGEIVRVVYPIEFWTETKEEAQANGHERRSRVEYFDIQRNGVRPNLIAHMLQNTYSYEYKVRDAKRAEIKEKVKGKSVDEILDDPELVKLGKISPAWEEPYSRESMILRKMRNNIVRKIPKDFSSAIQSLTYQKALLTDENDRPAPRDVTPDEPDHPDMSGANSKEFNPKKIDTVKANKKPSDTSKEKEGANTKPTISKPSEAKETQETSKPVEKPAQDSLFDEDKPF